MLHIISTNSVNQLSKLIQLSSTEDTIVAFENITSPKMLEKLQTQLKRNVLIVSNSEKSNRTITYDTLVNLCCQHSCIHTWY